MLRDGWETGTGDIRRRIAGGGIPFMPEIETRLVETSFMDYTLKFQCFFWKSDFIKWLGVTCIE
jgi:hypothetical protein